MRIVHISDTHNFDIRHLPWGDVLVHSGDLTGSGYRNEVVRALGNLEHVAKKFEHVIIVPGNHDFYFERHPEEALRENRERDE